MNVKSIFIELLNRKDQLLAIEKTIIDKKSIEHREIRRELTIIFNMLTANKKK